MNQRKTKKYMGYSGLLVILLIAIDQFTKWLAYTHLYQKPDVSVIDGVFQLKYLENDSAAFSLDPVSILQRIFHFSYFYFPYKHISSVFSFHFPDYLYNQILIHLLGVF